MRHIRNGLRLLLCCLATIASVVCDARANTITLAPVKDNTLYEDSTGALSNGAGQYLFGGTISNGARRRVLLEFDVAGNVPAGAQITGARLTLHMSLTVSGTQATTLNRVFTDWGEGASDAPGAEGAGAAAEPGDATWLHTFFDSIFWAATGGEFAVNASAIQDVDSAGFYVWSGVGMIVDIQAMLDVPEMNHGWTVVVDESGFGTAKRFESRENPDSALRPVLEIDFDLPTGIPTDPPGGRVILAPAFPNPFNPATTILYKLPHAGAVAISIFDTRGRRIRSLVNGTWPAGTSTVVWDGRDDAGKSMVSGVYFVRLRFGDEKRIRQIVLIK